MGTTSLIQTWAAPRRGLWSQGLVVSLVLHALVLLSLNQVPTAKVRLVTRPELLTVDLVELAPPPEPPPPPRSEAPPPPRPSLLDMGAASLPDPGHDLFRDLPPPSLDLWENPRVTVDAPKLDPVERRVETPSDKRSTLSLSPTFSPSLPADKLEVVRTHRALSPGPAVEVPASPGPTHTPRKPGVPSPQAPTPMPSVPPSPATPPSRTLHVPSKPTVAPPSPSRASQGRRKLREVKPPVPRWVEEQGIEASAKLLIQILEDGRIGNVELVVSSGYRELDNLAIGAVRQWLFEPGLVEYRSVKVNFKLQ